MTRNRKVDPDLLKHEYIYSDPPISYVKLAEKHGVVKNTVANRATRESWPKQREAVRQSLGLKVSEVLGDERVRFAVAARDLAMDLGVKVLEKFKGQLDDPEFKVSVRDMVSVAAMVRQLSADALATEETKEVLIDPDSPLGPDELRRQLDRLDQLQLGAGPDDGEAPAEAVATGAGED